MFLKYMMTQWKKGKVRVGLGINKDGTSRVSLLPKGFFAKVISKLLSNKEKLIIGVNAQRKARNFVRNNENVSSNQGELV
ncbi:hypothetical protein JCM30760_27070 [Thiomicrorhabdus hydrogeniphila]